MSPRQPIDDLAANELTCQRIRKHLIARFSEHGDLFASWWHSLSSHEKTEHLERVTGGTLPKKAASDKETFEMLRSMKPVYAARVLNEFSLEYALSMCDCTHSQGIGHKYQHRILHSIHYYLFCYDQAEPQEYEHCRDMMSKRVFPIKAPHIIMRPPSENDEPFVHRPLSITDRATSAQAEKLQQFVAAGLLKDGDVFVYFLSRQKYLLSLFCELFDLFEIHERHVVTSTPMSRLNGCDHCKQSCEEEISLKCQVCTITWWCCQGCKGATAHGRQCPHGAPKGTAILFGHPSSPAAKRGRVR